MPPAHPIIVIADDLSGAAEIAGIAFAHGFSAEVQRQFEPSTSAQVIAIDCDTRHLPATEAARRVREITTRVLATPHAWIFKKVDSVLRGNTQAEINAILEITGQRRALLVPANPTRGRTIVNGQYSIDSIPLDQTHFAHDPDYPRRSADVRKLMGDEGNIPVHTLPLHEVPGASGIFVPDVVSTLQLEQLSAAVASDTLLAGSADFFTYLLARYGKTSAQATQAHAVPLLPPFLLVCGSAASWPTRQADCLAANVPMFSIKDGAGTVREFRSLLIGIGQPKSAQSNSFLLSALSMLAATIAETSRAKTILMEGGATAAALAERMQWSRFSTAALAPPGIAALRPLVLNAPLLLIKPGSYAWPPEIWRAFSGAEA